MAILEPDLSVNFAGVHFPNPIGVGAIGEHWGHAGNIDQYVELNSEILLKHVKAGAGYIIMAGAYVTPETEKIIRERTRFLENPLRRRNGKVGHRMLKLETEAPYGVEGFLFVPAPFYLDAGFAKATERRNVLMMKALKEKKPKDVPIVINLGGLGDIAETWVDGAKFFESLGADMIEINLGCPLPTGLGNSVDEYFSGNFTPVCKGALIGDKEELVERIVRSVAQAVNIPVGVKLSPETGFPRIINIVKKARDAGAQFVQLFNAGVGIAPPDIYNGGKPSWEYMDGSPFCMASGSFLRVPCYKDVAAIARFVPGIQIAAAGGLVEPKHFIEAMMLGATMVQPCTGVIEQGRSLIRKGVKFMKDYMVEQGYSSMDQIIGLGQKYIKYNEDIDMMPGQTLIQIDHEKCIRCGRCVDNICQALYMERGKVMVHEERCAGCGGCILACQNGALKLGLRA
ncbi:4Fe-4S binding protein [Sphaerochaeta sp.]|jgi:dihydroorotate dehydrogenase/NAD-dependent dihydropyrimidine dehydrogenase PreA subunit|uniref:4Fe-4S binding protein n=1 Tax=Sphaerochaeta sp. TaxID=1972642 RepID=UPI002A367175|nr:4Fe-4S binding protein [Sphaerochaeta sp.]MDX9982696.1 4Fe-4S binding protein [Sphaerochaeta sp.]